MKNLLKEVFVGKIMKRIKPRNEYSIWLEDELIDILSFTKKEALEYERSNPDQTIEIIDEEVEDDE